MRPLGSDLPAGCNRRARAQAADKARTAEAAGRQDTERPTPAAMKQPTRTRSDSDSRPFGSNAPADKNAARRAIPMCQSRPRRWAVRA